MNRPPTKAAALMAQAQELQRKEDQATVAWVCNACGIGLRDLAGTRRTPMADGARRAVVMTLRYKLGWSQRRVAEALGIDQRRVRRLQRG
jgi:hypothetical protein